MAKTKAKHRAPSRVKYDQKCPPMTIRLTRELREVLEYVCGERKLGTVAREILTGKLEPALELLNRERDDCTKCRHGMDKYYMDMMKKTTRFTVPCADCGRDVEYRPSMKNWEGNVYPTLKNAFAEWICGACAAARKVRSKA